MELSPDLLTNVTFREQWRGYSPEQVDEFLERVAVAVRETQGALRDAEQRAAEAARRLADQVADDEIRRTLVLAQRTASTAVEEAHIEAARIVATADADASERLAAAEARLARLEIEIDRKEQEQLRDLAGRRAALEADIDALAAFAADHRARLKEALELQLRAVADSAFEVPVPPTTSGVVVGAGPTPDEWSADPDLASARAELLAALANVDDAVPEHEIEPSAPEALAPSWSAPEDEPPAVPSPALFDDAAGDAEHEPDGHAVVDAARADTGEQPAVDEPPAAPVDDLPEAVDPPVPSAAADEPVEWRHATIGDEPDDDPFLVELRRAVTDTEPLGPRDESGEASYDDGGGRDDPLDPPGRFRRRRSRR